MQYRISESELKLLVYLNEIASGYGEHFPRKIDGVLTELAIDVSQLCKDVSYLSEHGLAGFKGASFRGSTQFGFELTLVWITGLGADYLRELEATPGIARSLTVAAVKELWGMGKGVIVAAAGALLAELGKPSKH